MTAEQLAAIPLLVPVSQAAALVGLSKGSLYRLIGDGQVAAVTVGKTKMVPTRPLLRWAGVEVDG